MPNAKKKLFQEAENNEKIDTSVRLQPFVDAK